MYAIMNPVRNGCSMLGVNVPVRNRCSVTRSLQNAHRTSNIKENNYSLQQERTLSIHFFSTAVSQYFSKTPSQSNLQLVGTLLEIILTLTKQCNLQRNVCNHEAAVVCWCSFLSPQPLGVNVPVRNRCSVITFLQNAHRKGDIREKNSLLQQERSVCLH